MDGFKRRTEKKKESIRRAAMELFQAYGFRKVSIGDIAHKANVSHVTIYNHFGNKEELIRDIILTICKDIATEASKIIDSDIPYLEKLDRLIFNKSRFASQYQGELLETVAIDYPEIRRVVEEHVLKEVAVLLNKLVDEGKRLNYIRKDLTPQTIMYYFRIIRNGVYTDKELLKNIETDTKLLQDISYLCLFGLVEKQE